MSTIKLLHCNIKETPFYREEKYKTQEMHQESHAHHMQSVASESQQIHSLNNKPKSS